MSDKAPLQKVVRTAFLENMKEVYTCVPGHIIAFNPETQRAQVQIGIIRVDINGSVFNPPPIVDVPVSFPGDDYVLEFQIDPGCEGHIQFSQRCMDGWKQTGRIADNPVGRFHHKQDAIFIPGIRSLSNTIEAFANDGMRIRDKTGNRHVWIKNDGSMVLKNGQASTTLASDNSVLITNGAGSITILANGNININGVIFSPVGRVTAPAGGGFTGSNGIPYETHRHNETGTTTGTPRV
mgnify:FL=1